jgi:hypothetical protein
MSYAVARVTVPDTGHVTDSVAMSPTLLANGLYWLTRHTAVYEGFVAVTVPDVGLMTTVAAELSSGYKVASTDAAPKSCMKESVREPDFKPPIRVRHSPPNAVVSRSSLSMLSSALFKFVEKDVPLMLIE